MELREDEIAYLGEERCYCGHLEGLHDEVGWCLVYDSEAYDSEGHHFCSKEKEGRHRLLMERMRGNPKVGRAVSCRTCQREFEVEKVGP